MTSSSERPSVTELAIRLRRLGVHVSAMGDQLRVRGPRGSVTPELQQEIAHHRAALLRMIRGTTPPAARPVTAASVAPLSHNQRQLWFEQQLDPRASHYNVPVALAIEAPANIARLRQALGWLMRRHAGLRARFPVRGDAPAMDVAAEAALELLVVDVPAEPGDGAWERAVRAFVTRPFDLAEGPLFRACVVGRGGADWTLVISLHHIVADGWSMGILLKDFDRVHRALESGRPLDAAEEAGVSYEAFARWQAEPEYRAGLAPLVDAARARLTALAALRLPYDRPHRQRSARRGALVSARISVEDVKRLSEIARRSGVTLFVLVAAAYAVTLYCESGQERFALGTDESGRDDLRWDAVVGHFANQIVMAVDLSDNPTLEDVIGRTSRAMLDAYACRRIPFDVLVKAIRDGSVDRSPLFAAKIVMQPPLPAVMPPFRVLDVHNGSCKFDLLLNVWTTADGATLAIEYDCDLFAHTTGARIVRRLVDVVESMRESTSERLLDLDARLSRADRERSRMPGRFRTRQADPSLVRA